MSRGIKPAACDRDGVLSCSHPSAGSRMFSRSTASGQPPPLLRIEADTQARLDELIGKNIEGTLNVAERRELDKLGKQAEKISLKNVRLLAAHRFTARRAIGEKERGTSSGGADYSSNGALSCWSCHSAESDHLTGIDPEAGRGEPLFRPRRQTWDEHFVLSADWLQTLGHTATGEPPPASEHLRWKLFREASEHRLGIQAAEHGRLSAQQQEDQRQLALRAIMLEHAQRGEAWFAKAR